MREVELLAITLIMLSPFAMIVGLANKSHSGKQDDSGPYYGP